MQTFFQETLSSEFNQNQINELLSIVIDAEFDNIFYNNFDTGQEPQPLEDKTTLCGITTSWGRGPEIDASSCVKGEDDTCTLI